MPRGQKRRTLEKLLTDLNDLENSIEQYKQCISTLEEKRSVLKEAIAVEEFKEFTSMLKQQGLTIAQAKEFIMELTLEKQSA